MLEFFWSDWVQIDSAAETNGALYSKMTDYYGEFFSEFTSIQYVTLDETTIRSKRSFSFSLPMVITCAIMYIITFNLYWASNLSLPHCDDTFI